MYLRTTKRKKGDGSEVVYYQLAESVWNSARRQAEAKVVFNFGRADELDLAVLRRLSDSIRRVCDGAESATQAALQGDIAGLDIVSSKRFGGLYVLDALWRRVGLDGILAKHLAARRDRAPHETALFALVANRLLAPSSKLACYDTWLAREAHFPAGSALTLGQLYAAMDFLGEHVDAIERDLFFRTADLFSLDVDLIFYDTTTAFFEIDEDDEVAAPSPATAHAGPIREAAIRKRGHGKEGRDEPQVVVALAVTRDGLPVRSWVFPGNTADVATVARVREDLRGWRLSRVLFVGDAGMYSAENKKILSAGGGRYLLATPMRKLSEVRDEVMTRAGRFKEINENLAVKEVTVGDGESRRRYFLCLNRREALRQERHRARVLEILEAELAALAKRTDNHPKAACKILASQRFRAYLGKDEKGRPFIDRKKVAADERFDGKWVVTTNDDSLSAEDGALGYKAMMIIESCFRRMKTTGLKLRPFFHWTERRIVAHVKLCVLALLLERVAEIACGDTWRRIRDAIEAIQAVACESPSGSFLKTTRPSAAALAYLDKLKIAPPPRILAASPATLAAE
ncbi:MAG: IS1634 family transposase [Polyangiaceae bacterium]